MCGVEEGGVGVAGGSLGVGGTAHGLRHMTKVVTSIGLGVAAGPDVAGM